MADIADTPPDENNSLQQHDTLSLLPEKSLTLSDDLPPLETVRQMIEYDTFLRLSTPIQELLEQYHKDDEAIALILDLIQQHVVEYFGYRDVHALRTAVSRFPNDLVIKEAFYVKHNKITQGLVNQGQCALDINLFTLDGQPTNLFSQITPGLPLVIFAVLRLLTVYIAEAHAHDQWPVGKTISCADQPTTLEQRLENANQFKRKVNYEMPMLVDNMDNTFHKTYGSWPFRFYVINDGKLVFKAEPGRTTFAYDLNELDAWIDDFHRAKNT